MLLRLGKSKRRQKVSLLPCGLSAKQYQTLRDLVAPALPKLQTLEELKQELTKHYGVVRNTRIERAKFQAIKRSGGESMAHYEVRLHNPVRNCEFTGTFLNDNLVEQYITGNNRPVIARKLMQRMKN